MVTWPYNTPYAIFHWWSFGSKPLSLTDSEIFNGECDAMVHVTLIRPLNKGQDHSFWYQSISHIRLPIGSRTHCLATIQCESTPPPPRGPDNFHFFHKRLRIFIRFFTHLLYVPIYARLQKFLIKLSPILTKLCHIKSDYPVHICWKCPPSAETHALTRLCKSLIALVIVVCGK